VISKQRAELIRRHAYGGQDAAQRTFGHVMARVDRHDDRTAIRVAHHMVATANSHYSESGALQRPDYLRSRNCRNGARHKAASYQKSGNVECQRQFVRWPDFIEEQFNSRSQVGYRRFLRRSIAERGYAGTKLGGGAPDTVFVLLNDVGHVNDSCHRSSIAWHAC
jgi:hypothetical protein